MFYINVDENIRLVFVYSLRLGWLLDQSQILFILLYYEIHIINVKQHDSIFTCNFEVHFTRITQSNSFFFNRN